MTGVRRRLPAVLGAVLVVSLAGCADEQERYCGSLQEEKQTLTDLAERTDDEVLDDTIEVFRDLQGRAPGDIRDEWSTVVFAYETLAEAFDEAGASPSEMEGGAADGLSEEQTDRIEGAAAQLRTPRVMGAADAIEQHARDVCKVDLGLGR